MVETKAIADSEIATHRANGDRCSTPRQIPYNGKFVWQYCCDAGLRDRPSVESTIDNLVGEFEKASVDVGLSLHESRVDVRAAILAKQEAAKKRLVEFIKAITITLSGFVVAFLLLVMFAPASAWRDADATLGDHLINAKRDQAAYELTLRPSRSEVARRDFLREEIRELDRTTADLQRQRLAARLDFLLDGV